MMRSKKPWNKLEAISWIKILKNEQVDSHSTSLQNLQLQENTKESCSTSIYNCTFNILLMRLITELNMFLHCFKIPVMGFVNKKPQVCWLVKYVWNRLRSQSADSLSKNVIACQGKMGPGCYGLCCGVSGIPAARPQQPVMMLVVWQRGLNANPAHPWLAGRLIVRVEFILYGYTWLSVWLYPKGVKIVFVRKGRIRKKIGCRPPLPPQECSQYAIFSQKPSSFRLFSWNCVWWSGTTTEWEYHWVYI
jgi:hypothetical protein